MVNVLTPFPDVLLQTLNLTVPRHLVDLSAQQPKLDLRILAEFPRAQRERLLDALLLHLETSDFLIESVLELFRE